MHFNESKHRFYAWSVFICVDCSISVVKAAITISQLGVMCFMVLIQVNFIANLADMYRTYREIPFPSYPWCKTSNKREIDNIYTSVKRYIKKYSKYKKI